MIASVRRHQYVVAYLLLAVVAFVALAREEQLRGRESDHFNKVTAALVKQSVDICRANNIGRVEGNSRGSALRQSLLIDVRILEAAAKATQKAGGEAGALALRDRAKDFRRLAARIRTLAPIDCRV